MHVSMTDIYLPKDAWFYPILVEVVPGHVKGLQLCKIGEDVKVNGCQSIIIQDQCLKIRR